MSNKRHSLLVNFFDFFHLDLVWFTPPPLLLILLENLIFNISNITVIFLIFNLLGPFLGFTWTGAWYWITWRLNWPIIVEHSIIRQREHAPTTTNAKQWTLEWSWWWSTASVDTAVFTAVSYLLIMNPWSKVVKVSSWGSKDTASLITCEAFASKSSLH